MKPRFDGKGSNMKYDVTFKEITIKTVKVEADNLDHAQAIANEMLDDVYGNIEFEKNPDYYDVFVDNISERKF